MRAVVMFAVALIHAGVVLLCERRGLSCVRVWDGLGMVRRGGELDCFMSKRRAWGLMAGIMWNTLD